MDIKHLEYFVAIVNTQYNLSAASKKLFISQPALSAIIKKFEESEKVRLFERYGGKLQGLTPAGEILYKHAVQILDIHNSMLSEVREKSKQHRGKIRIGIPSLILSINFSSIITSLVIENPEIKFEIIERGAFKLKKLLLSKSLDFAVLLHPIDIIPGLTNEHVLVNCELSAFMSSNNPRANCDKIDWRQLDGASLATFNNSFIIHHHIMDKLRAQSVYPNICIQSSSWDFLCLSTENSDIITILPSQIKNVLTSTDIVEKRFRDPIPWTVVLHQLKKSRYSELEKYVLKEIVQRFKK